MINAMTLILILLFFFSFLDDDVPRRPSYGAYNSQLIRFARVCSHVECLTAKLNKQGYRYHEQCRINISFTPRPIGIRIL